ncbi:MAG: class I SAM-dependent methyltransferase [Vicinamibacterales bacterium]
MNRSVRGLAVVLAAVLLWPGGAGAQQAKPYEPEIGQGGKDVVWVPTPDALVELMLDMARVTPDDVVMDLGSGDGRNVIAAAKRGARAIGVEFNPDMVALARDLADEAGVGARATFVEGDMFKADVSKASVLALFLLPDNLEQLTDAFLRLAPGSRIVLNTFAIPGWEPDEERHVGGECTSWCTALLYLVPAQVDGRWTTPDGTLELTQTFQMVRGTLSGADGTRTVTGRLRGTALTLDVEGRPLTGTVVGDRITGDGWQATRAGR